MRSFFAGLLLGMLVLASIPGFANTLEGSNSLKFQVTLAENAANNIAKLGLEVPIKGRVFVIISRDGSSEPRDQVDVPGPPFWGKDVQGLTGGRSVVISDEDAAVIGYPFAKFSDIPPGEYYVQAFLNVYTTFHRADGHVVEMHLNSGAGQSMFSSPGNAYSRVQRLYLDPARSGLVPLSITEVIQPDQPPKEGEVLQQGNYEDTEWVKYVKIKSEVVSEFWGHDMYIGANILLPAGYEEHPDVYYPVIYLQGHWPGGRAPFRFKEGTDFYDFWTSDSAPRMIVVTFRDANPYYDTSYSVNSANVGPYGDAIMQELIPFIESRFRIIQEPWARVLAGGSTGGWEALAMQVWYPDFFGGTWAWCPDPVDFHYFQIVNIYEDENAYYRAVAWGDVHEAQNEWGLRVERPDYRRPDGNIGFTMRMENYWERALGPNGRSGGQWAIWQAVFGPVGADGYYQPLWDPITGDINHEVAEYWKENYDITYILQRDWDTIGPKLVGKIHVATGDMDSWHLNEAVYLLQEFLESTTDPAAKASFDYGRREPHCWIGTSPTRPGEEMSYAEFVTLVADYITNNAPEGADTESWKY